MNNYYIVFIWLVIMLAASQMVDATEKVNICGKLSFRWSFVWALIAFAPVFYIAVFTTPRSDTVLYLKIFDDFPSSWGNLLTEMHEKGSAYGFLFFEWMIKAVFGNRQIAFRVILGLIHSIPILFVFRKYSENYLVSLFVFLASGCHLAWMMNGLRQFMAVSIIMAATPLILKKKYVPMILVILLAASIHTTALIMLPIVFIVQGKTWNKRSLFFILITIGLVYYFSRNLGSIDNLLQNTEYAGAMASAAEMGDDGANPIRVLVDSVPALMALFGLKYIKADEDPVLFMCINMSIITAGISLVAMFTSGIMIGRLPIYVSLYSYIAIPGIINRMFTKNSKIIIYGIMVILYMTYYWYAYHGF